MEERKNGRKKEWKKERKPDGEIIEFTSFYAWDLCMELNKYVRECSTYLRELHGSTSPTPTDNKVDLRIVLSCDVL